MSKSVVRIGRRGKGVESAAVQDREGREANLLELDPRVEMIQALIPIGLEAVNDVLQREVGRGTLQPGGRRSRLRALGFATRIGLPGRSEGGHPDAAGSGYASRAGDPAVGLPRLAESPPGG